jgi:phage terminase large subunit
MQLSYRDNPYFSETKMRAEMEYLKKTNYKKFRHVWEGEYSDGGDAIIFSNTEIADIEVPEYIRPQFGLDFGANKDPNALRKLYVNEREKWIYIAREWTGATSVEGLAEGIGVIPEIFDFAIVADGSWPQSIETLKSKGFKVVPAKKGPGSILEGIQWLQGYKIYISPYCKEMREEARLYSWQTDKYTGEVLNIPEDQNNHGWDAVRYATEQNRMRRRVGVI